MAVVDHNTWGRRCGKTIQVMKRKANIGSQQQWQQIDSRMPGAIEVVNRYSDLTAHVISASVIVKSLADKIIFGLSRVCIEESQEILPLSANECPSGASKLLRGLYERTVTVLSLKKNPDKAERFLHYAAIQEHGVLAAARKLPCNVRFGLCEYNGV